MFLILGASESKRPFLEAAQQLGLETCVVDMDPKAPLAKCADLFWSHSLHDSGAIVERCQTLSRIEGVLSYSSATPVLKTAAEIRRTFALSGAAISVVGAVSDKRQMRSALRAAGLPVPESWIAASLTEALALCDRHLPVVIKPETGSAGSLGVFKAETLEGVRPAWEAAAKHSETGRAVVEAFIAGTEFSIDGICMGGFPVTLAVSRKLTGGGDGRFLLQGFDLFAAGLVDGRLHDPDARLACDLGLAAVRALDIDDSPFSADVIVGAEVGYIVEVGLLLDCKIDRLLNFLGFDVYQSLCKLALGCGENPPDLAFPSAALRFFYSNQVGRLVSCEAASASGGGEDVRVEWERHLGDTIRAAESTADTLGWVMVRGESPQVVAAEANKQIERMTDALVVAI